MKRFLVYLLLFPAIATVALYAVLYILTGALVDWLVSRTRLPSVIATTVFAYGVSALAAAWAGAIDVLAFGLVGAIPAAVSSWLSNRSV